MAAEMVRTEGLGKSLFAYNALISGCAKSRGYDRALGYFNDMVRNVLWRARITTEPRMTTLRCRVLRME